MTIRVLQGDCRDVLPTLPASSVHTVVTSPPYYALRSYLDADHPDKHREIGSEPTPDDYITTMVQVFREVRRVLRDDGTCWVNMGDSFSSGNSGQRVRDTNGGFRDGLNTRAQDATSANPGRAATEGLAPKQLLMMPARLALALQAPYYTGTIKNEADRIWLAAMIDTEGCMFIHKRKAGESSYSKYTRADGTEADYKRTQDQFGSGLEVANTSQAIVERCMAIVGKGSICSQSPDQNNRRKQTIYRWNLRNNECRDVVREIYPHLVAKQQQARILIGCPPSGDKASAAHLAMIALHNGEPTDVDFPVPASMFEPGWYVRSDIVWSKPNPMPESVTDRPTNAHEHVFLLSKSARYFYDADAIREPLAAKTYTTFGCEHRPQGNDAMGLVKSDNWGSSLDVRKPKLNGNGEIAGANARTVWTIAAHSFPDAHFATYPPALAERCIKAGCPKDGTVLDPFAGAGTTGLVADRLQRNAVLIELSPAYCAMLRNRITADAPLFAEVAD